MRFKNIAVSILIAISCMSIAVWLKTGQSMPKAQRWEYDVRYIGHMSEDKRAEFLNGFGQEGWEFVGVKVVDVLYRDPLYEVLGQNLSNCHNKLALRSPPFNSDSPNISHL